MQIGEDDHAILARTLYGEAKAGDERDARAIAHVVLNRVGYRNWPGSPAAVCLQPRQFSCWNDDDPNRRRIEQASGPWWERCREIAGEVLAGASSDPTRRSTHYFANYIATPRWARGKAPVYETEVHRFFNDIDTPPPADVTEALDQERPLSESRSLRAASGQGIVGVGSAADGVGQMIWSLEQGGSLMDGRGWIMAAVGLAIIALAAWQFYARLDDRRKGQR